MKYLPVHPDMIKSITAGMRIMHNGASNRLGWKGVIQHVNPHSESNKFTVRFSDRESTIQEYSRCWFRDNMYISCDDIKSMRAFNGHAYCDKYPHYMVNTVRDDVLPQHGAMKATVDAVGNSHYTPHEFKAPVNAGQWLGIAPSMQITTKSEEGLKARIALALADNPELVFEIYTQVGTAKMETTTTKILKFFNLI